MRTPGSRSVFRAFRVRTGCISRDSGHRPHLLAHRVLLAILLATSVAPRLLQAATTWPECADGLHINPPGSSCNYMTYGLGSLWMSDTDALKIWRIDPATGAVQSSLDSSWGGGIAFDGAYLWKALYSSPTIRCIDPANGSTVRDIPGVGSQQAGMTWDGAHLWIADRSTLRIYKLDPATGAQILSFDTPGPYPRGLVWYAGCLYHADSHEDSIYQLDPATGDVVSRISAPTRSSVLRGLASDGSCMWYSEWEEGIDRLVVTVSPDGRTVLSNPRLMSVDYLSVLTNNGGSAISGHEAHWAQPDPDNAHDLIDVHFAPIPDSHSVDSYGKTFAEFTSLPAVDPGDTQSITCHGYEAIWRLNHQVAPDEVEALSSVPGPIQTLYLADSDSLHITDPEIVAAANDAVAGETNAFHMAVAIHDYVAENMTYQYPHDTPWDALEVLHAGLGDCGSYSLLFTALCRAAGVPARWAVGFYYYENEDKTSHHVWNEAYIPGYGWIPFDSTRDDQDPLRHKYIGCEPVLIVYNDTGGSSRWWSGIGADGDVSSDMAYEIPLRVSDFQAAPSAAPSAVDLSWTHPATSDLSRVVVKRTQGAVPASRFDGVTVHDDTSPTPGAPAALTDDGLAPGTTYHYAVFAQSATGIWRSIVEAGANADSATASSSETQAVFRIDANGSAFCDGALHADRFMAGAADIAEWVTVSERVEPGDVLALDPDHPLGYCRTSTACSLRVAGVVSSAPGLTLALDEEAVLGRAILALAGIVPVKVTDEGGPIAAGDLLITSSTPGHAMCWRGPGPCPCALVGKALEPMTNQTGMILVLLTAH